MPHRIVFYTKPGCHLCEDAARLLAQLQPAFALTIQTIDIQSDPELFKKYFDQIPVLVIDDRVTLAAPIRAEDVRAALSISDFGFRISE
ncbi:MAG: glutaredoxin family protein [Chloroflexi bacterium]|nr:glutaredoxin family protein [Chloroflexota bacterium]